MAQDWAIVPGGQRQTTRLTPAGTGFQEVWEVTFTINTGPAAGTTAQVAVPASMYTPENVAAAIQARVDTLNAVQNL